MNLGAGQKRRAHRAGGLAALYNVVLTAGMAALFLVYSSEIVGFFDKSPGVIMFSPEYMLSVAPSYIVLAGALVLSQAMTGAGATLTNLVIDAPVLVLLVVPASMIVTESLSLPPIGLWLTIAAGNLIAAACLTIYYLRGSFLDKQV